MATWLHTFTAAAWFNSSQHKGTQYKRHEYNEIKGILIIHAVL